MKFDPTKTKLTSECEVPGILYAICSDPESGNCYAAGADRSVYCIDRNAEKPVAEKKWTHHENYVSALVWNAGTIVSAGFDRRLIWTDVSSGKQLRAIEAHAGWVRDLVFLPDGKRLVSVGDDMLVRLWDSGDGKLLRSMTGHSPKTPEGFSTAIYAVAVSPDGGTLASADRIGDVCLWETDSGKLIRRIKAPAFYTYDSVKRSRAIGGIRSVCFSPDGKQLALSGIGAVTNVDGFVGPCRVEVWDWRSAELIFTGQDKHKAVLNHIEFHPTQPWLIATGGGDGGGILAFWDQKQEEATHKTKLAGHGQRFTLFLESSRLVSVGSGGFQIWNLRASKKAESEKTPP